MQNVQGFGGEVARLIETALRLARTVQGHGHNEKLSRRGFIHFRSHLRDGRGEACAEFARKSGDALELESVDRATQGTVVFAEADGADEGRRRETARTAQSLAGRGWCRFEKVFAAAGARVLALRRDLKPTGAAYGRVGYRREWRVAEDADGRKESATQCMTQPAEQDCGRMTCDAPRRCNLSGALLRMTRLPRTTIATEVAPPARQPEGARTPPLLQYTQSFPQNPQGEVTI